MRIIKNFIKWKVDKVGKLILKLLILNCLRSRLLTKSLPITKNSLPLYQFIKAVYQLKTFAIVEVCTVYRVSTT